jgi:hypothetical protein
MPSAVFNDLRNLWHARSRNDEYFGTLVNAYLDAGGEAVGIRAGSSYVDVGTLNGYRAATALLADMQAHGGVEQDNAVIGWPAGYLRATGAPQAGAKVS